MSTRSRLLFDRVGLITLAVVFLVAVSASNVLLKGIRLDLTENRLYTLAEVTRSILGKIPEPINIYFFYSDKATSDIPQLRTYAGRVREMLEEFAEEAGGNLIVNEIDPLPFSEDEDRATGFGLQGVNLGNGGDPIYVGIAGTNSIGEQEMIPFLDPGKETFLEYDLAKLVYTLSAADRPVIGLISRLQMTAGFDPATQQMRQPWAITGQIEQLFEVRDLGSWTDRIDDDIDVLVVVHPADVSAKTEYAIDQFILRGGRAMIFLDPWSEVSQAGANPMNPQSMAAVAQTSTVSRLLTAWGMSMETTSVVGDDRFALTVTGFGQRPVRHLALVGVNASGLDPEDVITADLDSVNLGFAGWLSIGEQSPVTITPLITSSDLAGPIGTGQLGFVPDPEALRDGFSPTGEPFVMAARLSGEVSTAFPEGEPQMPEGENPEGPASLDEEPLPHLDKSDGPINVVLVTDSDMLADRYWVQVQNFLGQQLISAFAGNGAFVINTLENLTGSSDLISIRGRDTFQRPFTKVQDLRREADASFRETERQLQEQLQETESKLTELQASREDDNTLILSEEQAAELARFRDEQLRIRKELRLVQRNLVQGIEDLGTLLKIVNIAAVPILITLGSLVVLLVSRRRGVGA